MGQEPCSLNQRSRRDRRRLTPAMASFRLLVLDFVRDYIERQGASPSYGEIAAGLDSNREYVRNAVRSLVRDKLLLQGNSPRSLAMPSQRDAAIRALEGLGFRIDEDARTITKPLTDPPLLPPAALTYPIREHGREDDDGKISGKQGDR